MCQWCVQICFIFVLRYVLSVVKAFGPGLMNFGDREGGALVCVEGAPHPGAGRGTMRFRHPFSIRRKVENLKVASSSAWQLEHWIIEDPPTDSPHFRLPREAQN